MNAPCQHAAMAADVTPSANGCEECLSTGGTWVHLRVCMACGHIGCCDSSPGRHATAHWSSNPGHPVIRSFEPGEDWWWCYADNLLFQVAGADHAPSYDAADPGLT